ncbi:MAG: hypothetical protein IKX42_08405 [Fibrobacter sp.]|nr:hypothetical protein [Fibrobacter sp.]
MPQDVYKDIINLPYPRDDWNFLMKHPRMNVEDRAKIFHPFAALRGHAEALDATAERKQDAVENELTLEDPDAVIPDAGDENF